MISRDHTAIEQSQAYPEQPIWLTDEVSPWGSDIYVATDRDVPDTEMTRMSGTFLTRVFDGPYRDIGKWIREMNAWVERQGHQVNHLYFFYATCPKCAKVFDRNDVVLFAQVA